VGDAPSQAERAELAAALRTYVEYQRELGVLGFPRAAQRVPPPPAPAAPAVDAERPPAVRAATRDLVTAPGLGATRTREELPAHIGDCQRCKLAPHRTHLVFGVGNPRARLVFVGEAPGRDEDRQGEPFVGRAGQLLTEIITKGMRLARDDVYIANVIKCRPPENRNPEPDEVASCEPFLFRQIEVIKPKVIVALGKYAAQTLLRTDAPISRLRGRQFEYRGAKLIPTFHPAYLLRNPS